MMRATKLLLLALMALGRKCPRKKLSWRKCPRKKLSWRKCIPEPKKAQEGPKNFVFTK
jgi:hypothetical protein